MISRRFHTLAATVGLWAAYTVPGLAQQPDAPSRLDLNAEQASASVTVNQGLANTIAQQLKQSGQLSHYNVDIRVENGAVEVTGRVTDQAQHDAAVRIVQGVPGVDRVRDRLVVAEKQAAQVTPVTATTQLNVSEPRPILARDQEMVAPPAAVMAAVEPTPIFRAPPGVGGPGGPGMAPPPMPPNAWPTYAPYNNASRIAYPTLYPTQAFPFIGPFYPFPKVPLGWRSVQLKWEDGHWWYGRTATGHDYWRVRFW